MNNSTTTNERHDYLDLLKTIAIFFVILYHFNNLPSDFLKQQSAVEYINYFVKSILSTCVPLFFLVNGALLCNRQLNTRKHLIKTLKLIAITFIWGAITLAVLMFIKHQQLSLPQFFTALWTWKMGWINHLWFMHALVVVYVFAPLLVSAFHHNRSAFYLFFAAISLFTFGNSGIIAICNIVSYFSNQNIVERTFNFFNNFHAFRGIYGYTIGYFMLGGIVFAYRHKLNTIHYRRIAVALIIISMLLLSLYGWIISTKTNILWDNVFLGYDSLFTIINTLAIFVLVLSYTHRAWWGKIIKTIAQNSLGIYLLHRIFGFMLRPIFITLPFATNILTNIAFTLIVLAISLVCCLFFRRIPLIKHLFTV